MAHGSSSSSSCLENLKIMIYITGFSVLLILFIQSLHRKIPTVTIEQIYIPTLNKTATKNTTLYFDLKLDNRNPVGVYYHPMNLTFSYFPISKTITNTSTTLPMALGVYTIRSFHQEHHKEKHIRDMMVTEGMIMVPPGGGKRAVVMRVDLVGRVKFKSIVQWKRTVAVGVDVEVDKYTGEKVVKSAIKLVHSSEAPMVWICPPATLMLLIISIVSLN